jgi:hypothetical protein
MWHARQPVRFAIIVACMWSLWLAQANTPSHAAGSKVFTSFQDFSTCESGLVPTLEGSSVRSELDGEIVLASALNEDFSGTALNTITWQSGVYISTVHTSPPDVQVTGGNVVVTSRTNSDIDGSYIHYRTPQGYGAIEGIVSFSKGWYQHFGLATPGFEDFSRFALFSTGEDKPGIFADNTFYARVNNAESEIIIPLGPIPTTPVRLRIERINNSGIDLIRFHSNHNGTSYTRVDDVSLAGFTIPNQTFFKPLYVHVSNKAATATNPNSDPGPNWSMSANWIRALPYATAGTYTSCPFYASLQQRQTWGPISYIRTTPAGSTLNVEFRTSDDAINWSPFVTVASGGTPSSPPGIYGQFRVSLTRGTNAFETPQLASISIGYTAQSSLPPQIIPGSGPVGTRFLVVGDGFTANTSLTVQMAGRMIGILNANANGGCAFYVDSSGLGLGSHTITINGAGRAAITLSFIVTIGTPRPPAPGGTLTFEPIIRIFVPAVQR